MKIRHEFWLGICYLNNSKPLTVLVILVMLTKSWLTSQILFDKTKTNFFEVTYQGLLRYFDRVLRDLVVLNYINGSTRNSIQCKPVNWFLSFVKPKVVQLFNIQLFRLEVVGKFNWLRGRKRFIQELAGHIWTFESWKELIGCKKAVSNTSFGHKWVYYCIVFWNQF
jgi:hypothetical protein